MKTPIYVTSQDKERLHNLLAVTAASGPRQQGDWKPLADELRRAVIVAPNEVPADVITMNSRADLVDLDNGETMTFTLVFPQDAYLEEEKISVLAPIGAGMLGYRVGDEFEWNAPQDIRRMRVAKVHYQPEAAADFDR
ncbi:MAG TPA: nucleoside diphosphate kinase regulator [Chthoniobacterales bacterium]|jgi:regulator of nucleoside diphosphate kinase